MGNYSVVLRASFPEASLPCSGCRTTSQIRTSIDPSKQEVDAMAAHSWEGRIKSRGASWDCSPRTSEETAETGYVFSEPQARRGEMQAAQAGQRHQKQMH